MLIAESWDSWLKRIAHIRNYEKYFIPRPFNFIDCKLPPG